MKQIIESGGKAAGSIDSPGDKSISIRSVLFASIADGISRVDGLGTGEDILSAVSCVKQLGINVEKMSENRLTIHGKGLRGFEPSSEPIYCGNSGTTMRLLAGILAGQKRAYTLSGDESLNTRPMKRIIDPLKEMGSGINSSENNGCAPLKIEPSGIRGITYHLPVASAQVKSAILLSGLYSRNKTTVIEPAPSRDHTELMLASQGVDIDISGNTITLSPPSHLNSFEMSVPGDISGAAFFMVLGALLPDSDITIRNTGINETRSGIIDVLTRMGAKIELLNRRISSGEPVADIRVRHSQLRSVTISGEEIPKLIDEIPVIAVAAAAAQGITVIKDAKELRVKETDRISAVCENLMKMGADIEEKEDGMIINGGNKLRGTQIESYGDHRIAMAFAIAGTIADNSTEITGSEWADISYPGFFEILENLRTNN
ncbi:3-phosphoshikimate 1-carboxyvinyltransferase [candidate division KSB1 bacterium]